MSSPATVPTTTEVQPKWRILSVDPTTNAVTAHDLPLLPETTPVLVVEQLRSIALGQTSPGRRFLQRLMLRKVVVNLVKIQPVSRPNLPTRLIFPCRKKQEVELTLITHMQTPIAGVQLFDARRDQALTHALKNPEMLASVSTKMFLEYYRDLVVPEDGGVPAAALQIQWETSQTAVHVVKGAVVVASMVANAIIQFA